MQNCWVMKLTTCNVSSGRQRQEDQEFDTCLGYIEKPISHKQNKSRQNHKPKIPNKTIKSVAHYGGLNRDGSYRLMCLNIWSIGSSIIERCGLAGIDVALLEEVCH